MKNIHLRKQIFENLILCYNFLDSINLFFYNQRTIFLLIYQKSYSFL